MLFILIQEGAAEAAKQPQWYEVVAGVLAIPAAIIGLAYSYALIKNTRLDSRDKELDILKKERELGQLPPNKIDAIHEVIQPLLESRRVQYIVLRFILLYLILSGFNIIKDVILQLFSLIGSLLYQHTHFKSVLDNPYVIYPFVIAGSYLPTILYGIIFLAFGWPLFKDINQALGINLKGLFRLRNRR